jgi:hypothetical protein
MMQPYLTELIARQRVADLHRSARQHRLVARRRPVRGRVGWALVTIGLALVSASGDG